MEYVEAGGARVPVIGLGTWDLRGRTCIEMVSAALKLGYRHIDTAAAYNNEQEVGEGLRASGVRRDEVHVTTKVWHDQLRAADFARAAAASLKRLGVDRIDVPVAHRDRIVRRVEFRNRRKRRDRRHQRAPTGALARAVGVGAGYASTSLSRLRYGSGSE